MCTLKCPYGCQNDFKRAPNLEGGDSGRAHALITTLHNVNTIWKKKLEQCCIYIKIDPDVGCERSEVDERDLSHMV